MGNHFLRILFQTFFPNRSQDFSPSGNYSLVMNNLPSELPDSNGSPAPSTRLVLDRLIVQHQQWLRQIILARVGEPQATDEVFQEVAAQALLQKSPLLDESKTSAWLYRVAVRQCLLYRRKCG